MGILDSMGCLEHSLGAADLEQFEIFDEQGESLGLLARNLVHERGVWHKAAQVFVFNAKHELLLQRRAANKDLYPDLWDYSVGEHLQPGETYLQGAMRGLQEELQLSPTDLIDMNPLGGLRRMEQKGEGYLDREFQQAYRCQTHVRAIQWDPIEVAEVRFVPLSDIARQIKDNPGQFTPWFIVDMYEFGFLPGPTVC